MSTDDPFYNPDDSDKTVIRPMPGGGARPAPGAAPAPAPGAVQQPSPVAPAQNFQQPAAAPQQPAAPQAAPVAASSAPIGPTRTGSNIITDAAAQLLALVGRLKNTAQHADVAGLHRQVVQAIQTFENNAREAGASPEALLISRYGLCAAIDETVLNTPWGSTSVWSSHSMLITFHQEAAGGEKFFQVLDHLRQEPAKNIDLIELYAIILSLGLQGKYRMIQNGHSMLDGLRDELFNIVRQQRGEYERELSPNWHGLQAKANTLAQQVPLWVIAALTGIILLCVYLGFNFMLVNNAKPALDTFQTISQPYMEREIQE